MEKIICRICGKKLRVISWVHLRQHNITTEEYKKRYPDQDLLSDIVKRALSLGPSSMMGISRTQVVKDKVSQAQKGQHHSLATEFKKGHNVPKEWMEINRIKRTGTKSLEITKLKQSLGSTKWFENPKNKKKFLEKRREASKKRIKWKISREELCRLYFKKKLSIRQIARKLNTKYGVIYHIFERYKIPPRTSKEGRKINPVKLSEDGKRRLSEKNRKAARERWKDPKYRGEMLIKLENARKTYKAVVKPNKPEKNIISLLEQNNLPYFYNLGDEVIAGKIPDFVHNGNDKKVIELHGRAYHDPNFKNKFIDIPYHRTEEGTIEHYNKYGYKCLVIWDDELKKPNEVLSRIKDF